MSQISMSTVNLVIIGGGCSAVALIEALSKSAPSTQIAVVEPRNTLGLGVAYGTELDSHILNVPAEHMGINSLNPRGFLEWSQRHATDISEKDFVSRRVFGGYLASIIDDARSRGVDIRHFKTRAKGIKKRDNDYCISLEDGQSILASRLVIATGHEPTAHPISSFDNQAAPQFRNPWILSSYADIGPREEVVILGSGLSALDVIVALNVQGHQGHITCISRRGLLPMPHASYSPWDWVVPERLITMSLRSLMRTVREEVVRATAAGSDWRAVIDALRPYNADIWRSLSLPDQRRFLRHLRPYWEVIRHRAPAHVCDMLSRMSQAGRFSVQRGRISDLMVSEGAVRIGFGMQELVSRVVFNCIGASSLSPSKLPSFIRTLIDSRLAKIDPHTLGISCDRSGFVLDPDGKPHTTLAVIGPLRRGSDWESSAVREIREQANVLSQHLVLT